MGLRSLVMSAAFVFFLTAATDSAGQEKHDHSAHDHSGDKKAAAGAPTPTPRPTPAPAALPAPPPSGSALDLAAIQAFRARKIAEFPQPWNVELIAGTMTDNLAGRLTQADLDLFERYLPMRAELSELYSNHRKTGDPNLIKCPGWSAPRRSWLRLEPGLQSSKGEGFGSLSQA